jgi:hypothetical protein
MTISAQFFGVSSWSSVWSRMGGLVMVFLPCLSEDGPHVTAA